VAVVTLNRPDKHNAMNHELTQALIAALEDAEADQNVRVVILTGVGDKAFCAGGDMKERVDALEARESGTPVVAMQPRGDVVGVMAGMSKPVIGAINGFAYGGGARLALCTDIRLASTTATFRFVGSSYGLVVSASQLPALVGPAVAKELIFTTRVVDAAEAHAIGIVNHVYEPAELLPAAIAMAEQISANSPDAIRWAKKVIDEAAVRPEGAELERTANRELMASRDHSNRFRAAAERVVGPRPG
jgi:enoyl-CoA hydratase